MSTLALSFPSYFDPIPNGGWKEIHLFVSRTGKVGAVTLSAQPDDVQERLLVQRAKAGDRKALGALLSHHGPRLYRAVLLPRLGDEARARDALSATYERAIVKLDQYEWQPCGIYPWLRIVALRIALDMLRSGRREVLFDGEDVNREIEAAEAALANSPNSLEALQEQQELDEARTKLRDAMNRLNPRYATVIRLRILEDRSREEVALQMGVSPATFDVLLHRSMAALKKAIGSGQTEGSD